VSHTYRIIYQKPGECAVFIVPAPNYVGTKEALIKQAVPDGVEYFEVHQSIIPGDDYFREAWDIKDKKIEINMEKAKKIHIDNLRSKRKEIFTSLDTDYLKSIEENDVAKTSEISKKKKQLRDMPLDPVFSSAQNADHLKSLIPDYMK